MRVVLQRVRSARVTVGEEIVGEIGPGLLLLVGFTVGDSDHDLERVAAKIPKLRLFDDAEGRWTEALGDREILCVSQFTLYGECRKGTRPSFTEAAPAAVAEPLYDRFCALLGAVRGRFGAAMAVESVNDGPVTLLL